MIISRKDNNPYLLIAGTDQPQKDPVTGAPIANPHFGEVTIFEVPDDPEVVRATNMVRGQDTRRAIVRARASAKMKKGAYAEALALLKTIGE